MTAIVIIAYNVPELIIYQFQAIRKFCKDPDYTIIIIDNSSQMESTISIQHQCNVNGVEYYKCNSSHASGTESHVFASNFAYTKLKDRYDYFMWLDHDNFPIRDFSVKDILGDKHIAGLGQNAEHPYFWPGCMMWNNKLVDNSLVNFSANHDLHLDTGGEMYRIVETYGKEKCIFFNEEYHQNPQFNQSFYNFYSLINNQMFLHFVNGSNWNHSEQHENRINSLINILKEKTGI